MPQHQPITSPCIRLCTLDESDICVGCGRTLDEIKQWTSYSPAEQTSVLERCWQRRERPNHR